MDASSIITQVSRDDELGAFNNEKGTYHVNRSAPPYSTLPSSRSAPGCSPPDAAGISFPCTCYGTRIRVSLLVLCCLTSSPVSPPVLYASNFSRPLCPPPRPPPSILHLEYCHPFKILVILRRASSVLRAMSQISWVPYAMSCPLTFHVPSMRSSLRASCKEDSKKLIIKG